LRNSNEHPTAKVTLMDNRASIPAKPPTSGAGGSVVADISGFGGNIVMVVALGLGLLVGGGGRVVVVVVGFRMAVEVALGVVVGGKGGLIGGGGNSRFISSFCVPSDSKLEALL
jgi:hypothetical protein